MNKIKNSEVVHESLCNVSAEREVLGSLMANNMFEVEVREILQPKHFASSVHGDIYKLIIDIIKRNKPATPIMLKTDAESMESLKEHGGYKYLQNLYEMATAVHIKVIKHHAELIKDLWQKRQIVQLNSRITNKLVHNSDIRIKCLLDEQLQRLFELHQTGQEQTLLCVNTVLKEAMTNIEKAFKSKGTVGVASEITSIDDLMGGLHDSNLIIIAGRPGMGKTALATSIAHNISKKYRDSKGEEGSVVGFFSLEMSRHELMYRLIAKESGLASYKLRQGSITEYEYTNQILPSVGKINDLALYIDDTPALTIDNIHSRARYFKRTHNLGLVIIDYLQLVQSPEHKKSNNRTVEVSEITRGLKNIAKDLNIPVIALSQLSRNVETREDKRPQLSDLRDSGSIEQDADIVGFVYREEYYLNQKKPSEDHASYAEWQEKIAEVYNKAEFIIGKHRYGPTGKTILYFDPITTTFYDVNSGDIPIK